MAPVPIRISHRGLQRSFILPTSAQNALTIQQAQSLIKSAFALTEECVGLYEPQSQMIFPFSLVVSSPTAFTEDYTLVLSNSGIQHSQDDKYNNATSNQSSLRKRIKRPHSVDGDEDDQERDIPTPIDSTATSNSLTFNFSPRAVASGRNNRFPHQRFAHAFASSSSSSRTRPATSRGRAKTAPVRSTSNDTETDVRSALTSASARSGREPVFTSANFAPSFASFQPYTSRSKEEAFQTLFSKHQPSTSTSTSTSTLNQTKPSSPGQDFEIEYSDEEEYDTQHTLENEGSTTLQRHHLTELEQLQRRAGFTQLRPSELFSIFKRSAQNGYMDRPTFEVSFARFIPLSSLRSEDERREFKHTLNRLFDLFDRNHDGRVDFREFSAGLMLLCQGDTDEKIALAFSLYDQDDDGFISFDEMCSYFQSFFMVCFELSESLQPQLHDVSPATLGEATAIQCFNEADHDRDGYISFDEFVAWYSQPSNAHLHETQLTGLELPEDVDVIRDDDEIDQDELDRQEVAQIVRQLSRHHLGEDDTMDSDEYDTDLFDANDLYVTDVANGADDEESEYNPTYESEQEKESESYHRSTYEQWLRQRQFEQAQAQARVRGVQSTNGFTGKAPTYPRSNEALGLRPQTRRPVPEPRHLGVSSSGGWTSEPIRRIPIRVTSSSPSRSRVNGKRSRPQSRL